MITEAVKNFEANAKREFKGPTHSSVVKMPDPGWQDTDLDIKGGQLELDG